MSRVAWNKGLTKETDARVKQNAMHISEGRIGILPWNAGLSKEEQPYYGKKHSQEWRDKVLPSLHSEKAKEKQMANAKTNPNYGMRGKHHSDETKRCFTKQRVGTHQGENNPFFGKEHSPKARELMKSKRANLVIPFKDTSIEKKMHSMLQECGIEFETHKPILGQPDIFIQPNICIFCDGDYFHANPEKYKSDDVLMKGMTVQQRWDRDEYVSKHLEKEGFVVLRFWEHEISVCPNICLERVLEVLCVVERCI